MDSYTDSIFVSVWLKTAPRSEQMLKRKRDRSCKLCVRGFSQWPDTAQTYLVTAALAWGDLPGRSLSELICDLLEQENSLLGDEKCVRRDPSEI